MKELARKLSRPLELLLAVVFLLAAALKAHDANLFVAQIHAYKIFTNPLVLGYTALITLSIETFLGVAMLLGLRLHNAILAAVIALLVFFTCLIAYSWPEDCGCFGKVHMGPQTSIVKNIVMIFFALVAMLGFSSKGAARDYPVTIPVKLIAALLVAAATVAWSYPQVFQAAPAPPASPTAPNATAAAEGSPQAATSPYAAYRFEIENGESFDLAKGEHLVAALSMTCDHCKASVPNLNTLVDQPDIPRLVAICYEPEPNSLQDFRTETGAEFPMHSIGNNFIEFSKLIGAEPPRLAWLKDGIVQKTWDEPIPPYETVLVDIKAARK